MKTGLVIGKFLPPHRGHLYLIDVARAHCDRLIVVVCDRAGDVVEARSRAGWLRELYPDVDVRVVPDIGFDDDSKKWAAYTVEFLGFAPDIVFTSEDYGEPYAKFLGAEHYLVDHERKGVFMSGTTVRADVSKAWSYLPPQVRVHFVRRVAVVGAESTGTTTLARALAERYETTWVPEYGREYSEEKMRRGVLEWKSDEFIHIAVEQLRRENEAARNAKHLLVCDTDAFATTLWHERYMGLPSETVARIADQVVHDLYILTGDEIPFVQDGFRDGEHIRHGMQRRFFEELKRTGRPYLHVEGSPEERLAAASRAVDKLLTLPHGRRLTQAHIDESLAR
ncbi:MAG: hypothetical protein A3C93_00235 [Candidatus Lloydbacteria bacterium RIFCSPHIGHO2_02_FULL_54_17]|uniref:NadR/Ttd14 AAA domain-containing protein n=1 Tax=Candidatus Lloydbacteria bacterium RIFCSPHIGHO2_02_FULL_54_17 TaxID=1798664 RepID=A0A1G2DK43_9BACT|nr:MAG: hypothetical protein A2762_03985 [Candidatus Lloydbacteria bacterium RIFCSPHIGHO2_01_FULL_54_11]OGZ13331.1 MAG: hypothetical protein A3C93_00235 [Candidatus Lloydbacteria bacterium RIFCSPHIGHO2_02_FULL_54_17]OGZ17139.1 MAG: hypothetical protein A3H76_03035 [Candidatus Lloydbacteria bacterium RIFCSPLOWO2_02_FULL_54_12]